MKVFGKYAFNIISILSALATLYQFYSGNVAFAILLVIVFVISLIISIVSFLKNRKNEGDLAQVPPSPPLTVDGKADELLTLAEGNRTVTKTIDIHEATHTFLINEKDMTTTFRYSGRCISKTGSKGMIFSISGYNLVRLKDLNCVGYDLLHDPQKTIPIQPVLRSTDGLCKKIELPFPQKLKYHEGYSIELSYTWPDCIRDGLNHIDSSLSFKKNSIKKYNVNIIFIKNAPPWIRVFTLNKEKGQTEYEKLLPLANCNGDTFYYSDIIDTPISQSVRIYQFPLNDT